MPDKDIYKTAQRAAESIIPSSARTSTIPITLASSTSSRSNLSDLTSAQRTFLKSSGFNFAAGDFILLTDEKGDIARVVCGIDGPSSFSLTDNGADASSCFFAGTLASRLPQGDYNFASDMPNAALVAQAWTLGSYNYDRYKSDSAPVKRRLKPGKSVDIDRVRDITTSVFLGRDLINTPANDLGPDELEATARSLAKAHAAKISVITGDDLLKKNFPMIHAVGRASNRPPRLIDMQWGKKSNPAITLVGKGIVFDTGGLNIKPGSSMTLMKKDMGGAATALATAAMIMSAELPVRLRVLLPVAENSISSNAYRPGDVLESRNGMTVEIGNTDAEGRLVLADALALADEDKPDALFCFATLTGAARVALGPDLPPLYTSTDALADQILAAANAVHDPLWRMPFWAPYDQTLHSAVADVSHISNGPFAGSVTAALFLKRFVNNTDNFAHIDLYGWVPVAKPGCPKGGDPQGARAIFEWARQNYK